MTILPKEYKDFLKLMERYDPDMWEFLKVFEEDQPTTEYRRNHEKRED